jgi:hypothetical protein
MRIAFWINKATGTHSEVFNTYYFYTATMADHKYAWKRFTELSPGVV